jgi:hypothetical protein
MMMHWVIGPYLRAASGEVSDGFRYQCEIGRRLCPTHWEDQQEGDEWCVLMKSWDSEGKRWYVVND